MYIFEKHIIKGSCNLDAPTPAPTLTPTLTPSTTPTRATIDPSHVPSNIPSITPSEIPIKAPTDISRIPTIMTENPTNITEYPSSVVKSNLLEFLDDTINVNIIIGIIFGICLFLSMITLLHRMGIFNKCCPISDSDDVIVYIKLGFRLSDFVTDILFVLYLSEYIETIDDIELFIIYITSIATLVLPFILNILFTLKIIRYKKWFNSTHVSSYFYKNIIFMPLSVLTMDVLLSLKITKAKFLGLKLFDSGKFIIYM